MCQLSYQHSLAAASQSSSVKWAPSHIPAGLIRWEPECLPGSGTAQGGNEPPGRRYRQLGAISLSPHAFGEASAHGEGAGSSLVGCWATPLTRPSAALPELLPRPARPWAAAQSPQGRGPGGWRAMAVTLWEQWAISTKASGPGDQHMEESPSRRRPASLRHPSTHGAADRARPSLPMDRWESESQGHTLSQRGHTRPAPGADRAAIEAPHPHTLQPPVPSPLGPRTGCPASSRRLSAPNKPHHLLSRCWCLSVVSPG